MTALVYQATNRINGKHYIGFTARSLLARERQHRAMARQGLGHYLHAAMRKHGQENFLFETIADFDDDEDLAKVYEIEAIAKYKPEYNISRGGEGYHVALETRKKIGDANRGKTPSEETRQKMREARKKYVTSDATKKKISDAHRGRKASAETRRKMAGRKVSKETRSKLAAANIGKTPTEATRAKLRALNLGKKASEETKRKMSAALKGRPAHNRGVLHSEETKAKMRAAQLGKVRSEEARANMRRAQVVKKRAVQCVTDGRVFDSAREAEQFYGLCQAAVTRVVTGRAKSTRGLRFAYYGVPK